MKQYIKTEWLSWNRGKLDWSHDIQTNILSYTIYYWHHSLHHVFLFSFKVCNTKQRTVGRTEVFLNIKSLLSLKARQKKIVWYYFCMLGGSVHSQALWDRTPLWAPFSLSLQRHSLQGSDCLCPVCFTLMVFYSNHSWLPIGREWKLLPPDDLQATSSGFNEDVYIFNEVLLQCSATTGLLEYVAILGFLNPLMTDICNHFCVFSVE